MTPTILKGFVKILDGDRVHADPAELLAYSFDGTFQQRLPDLVVAPRTTDEVAAVVRLAYEYELPIIARGAGTSLAGGTIPIRGGVVVNLSGMNRMLEVDRDNACAVVQPGVVTADLQRAVEAAGLFYPPDPASLNQCTLGGNVACNAGGPRCLKYGVTGDYVLGLTVVLAGGDVLRTGGKMVKNVTGYQLAQLFVGSEGTLGIVTEIIVRLLPLPRFRRTASALFPTLEVAGAAVTAILSAGIIPATLELMDRATINLVEDYLGMGLPRDAEALLLMEQDGNDPQTCHASVHDMARVATEAGALAVRVASSEEEREALWRARRAVSGALGRAMPNKLGEDIAVPRAAIPAMIRRIADISTASGLPIPVFGHAGDGNLHPNILFDFRRPGEYERVERAASAIFSAAIALGGTLSGEHGIGSLKREFLVDDLGNVAVDVMRRIKVALDPKGLFNPGKVFPERESGSGHPGFLSMLPALRSLGPE
jgi:glycolate oxidase